MTDVWMSTLRRGIAIHTLAGRKTTCGRYVGDGTEILRGFVLSLDEAMAQYEPKWCMHCAGQADVVAPRTARGGGLGAGG